MNTKTMTDEEVVEHLALTSVTQDLSDPEIWLGMAIKAESFGNPEVAQDLLNRAAEIEQLGVSPV